MLKELLKKHLKELLKVLDGRVNLELFVTPTNTTPSLPPPSPLPPTYSIVVYFRTENVHLIWSQAVDLLFL